MKKILFALVIALLAVMQVITPAAAATPEYLDCGDVYVVRWGDTLSKIAAKCGTTVSDILARNPFIRNPNLIYSGWSLKLTGEPVVIPDTGGSYTVRRGDTLSKIAGRFGTTVWTLMQLNPFIWNANVIYTGWVLTLPSGSDGYVPPAPYPYPYPYPYPGAVTVTVSKYQVEAGGTFKVSVAGFPKNADIDYRIGQLGEGYTIAVDGLTDENGRASATLTMPDSANPGEYWVVIIVTTEIKEGTQITTPRIKIID